MKYQKAKQIRESSFGDLMAKKMVAGGGIGESLGATISDKTKAKITGIKESFDPLNMAKFLTGGSSLGPALLGKMLGRSKSDIKYFSGLGKKNKGTASKLGPLGNDESDFASILYNIENLLKQGLDDDELQRQKENNFAEERESERLRRHKELIEAITGKPYSGKATATKMEKDEAPGGSILDDILGLFGLKELGKTALKGLGSLAGAAVGAGGVLLGAAAAAGIAYFMYKVLTDESSYDKDPNSPFNLALKQAEKVGGLAGVYDEMERRKTLPEYERTMLELKDAEKTYNEGAKLTDVQLEGYAKRGGEAARAVEDYKKQRDGMQSSSASLPTSATPESTSTPATPSATPVSTPGPATPSATPESSAIESPAAAPIMSERLGAVQNENLDLSIPESVPDPTTVVNNNSVKSYEKTGDKIPMPAVRNTEPTFQDMILYSTRVV
jgi:hypothetical protein